MALAGRSLFPLARSGDSVLFERAAPESLREGDVAIGAQADGTLVAHVVCDERPLRTASFLGHVDTPPLEVLGRAVALRRGGRELPLGTKRIQRAVRLAHRGAARLGQSGTARWLWGRRGAVLGAEAMQRLRRAFAGELHLRPLAAADLPAAVAAYPRLPLARAFINTPDQDGFGAFDRRGHLVGLALAHEGEARIELGGPFLDAPELAGLFVLAVAEWECVWSGRLGPRLEEALAREGLLPHERSEEQRCWRRKG